MKENKVGFEDRIYVCLRKNPDYVVPITVHIVDGQLSVSAKDNEGELLKYDINSIYEVGTYVGCLVVTLLDRKFPPGTVDELDLRTTAINQVCGYVLKVSGCIANRLIEYPLCVKNTPLDIFHIKYRVQLINGKQLELHVVNNRLTRTGVIYTDNLSIAPGFIAYTGNFHTTREDLLSYFVNLAQPLLVDYTHKGNMLYVTDTDTQSYRAQHAMLIKDIVEVTAIIIDDYIELLQGDRYGYRQHMVTKETKL